MKAITKRFRMLRTERGLSQRETAARASIPMGRYWEIENGYREPDVDDLAKLARVFRCDVADILGQPESVAS